MKKSTIVAFFVALSVAFIPAGNVSARSPCLDAMSILLGSGSTPKYQFTPFSSLTENYKAGADEFITVTDTDIQSEAFSYFVKSKNSSRVIIKQDASSKATTNALNVWVKNPKIFFAVPDDLAGTKKVFLSSLSDKEAMPFYNQMKKTNQILAKEKEISGLQLLSESNPATSHADEIKKYIEDSNTSGPVFVFAHNEDGKLKFPDGSDMDISSFAELAYAHDKEPVVMSCNTYKSSGAQFEGAITTGHIRFEDFALGLVAAQKT